MSTGGWLALALILAMLLLRGTHDPEPPDNLPTTLGKFVLTMLGVLGGIATLVVLSVYIARRLAVDDEGVAFLILGAAVAVCTLSKPWWFWYHARALALRAVLGDAATTALYLIIAAAMLVAGGYRIHFWVTDVRTCRSLYTAAPDSHARLAVLRHEPRPTMPAYLVLSRRYRSLTCGSYRERGAF